MVKILSFDPGTRKMGWAVLCGDRGMDAQQRFCGCGLLVMRELDRGLVLRYMAQAVLTLMAMWQPEIVVTEYISWRSNGQSRLPTLIALSQCVGVVLEHAGGVPVYGLPTGSWKSLLFGTQSADKSSSLAYVQHHFPQVGKIDHNTSDAICIGEAAQMELGHVVRGEPAKLALLAGSCATTSRQSA